MCDHSFAVQAAMQAFGMRAEVMPEPDDETTKIGQDLVLGRECAPCMVTVGDVIRLSRRPGFDPKSAAVLMPTAPGPCRFGQYSVLHRHILDEQGLEGVEILSPSSENAYFGFGEHPKRFRLLAWDGIVAVDLLQQLLHRYRPYECEQGRADAIYAEGLPRILAAVRRKNKGLIDVLRRCGEQFEALAIDESEDRPLIGVIGEIYVRCNKFTNLDVIRRVEALGGEVSLATVTEWVYLTTWNPAFYARMRGDYLAWLGHTLTLKYQRHRERLLTRPVAPLLRHPYETPTGQLKKSISAYLEPTIETEAVMTLAKAVELGRHGASGILAVMPFSCMPGIISAAIAPRLRADLGHIPWLDISYDLQKSANIETRLEAFMSQARHFQRRALAESPVAREMSPASTART
jgi:predicted nucleotide-binding protein (sugar kinase/HSP70/actin superfamily)